MFSSTNHHQVTREMICKLWAMNWSIDRSIDRSIDWLINWLLCWCLPHNINATSQYPRVGEGFVIRTKLISIIRIKQECQENVYQRWVYGTRHGSGIVERNYIEPTRLALEEHLKFHNMKMSKSELFFPIIVAATKTSCKMASTLCQKKLLYILHHTIWFKFRQDVVQIRIKSCTERL